jgi:hypothetical protein
MKMTLNKSFVAAATAVMAVFATQAGAQISFNTFISESQLDGVYGSPYPIGITFAGNKFVGTAGYNYGSNVLYQSNLTGTSVTPFGTLPYVAGEAVLSASPTASAFGSNNIYSGSGADNNLWEIPNSGGAATLFSNGLTNGIVGDVRGIGFDTSGLYGNDMIVTTTAGDIYKVNSSGNASLLASVGADTEGIGFASQQFGTYAAGTLFVASEGTAAIWAVSPTGGLNDIVGLDEAESISFVPSDIASETSPLEGFYGVNYPYDIEFANAAQFVPYAGDVIVGSEAGGYDDMYALSLDSADNPTLTPIGTLNQPEDSIFVTQGTLQTHGVPDGGMTAAMVAAALLALGVFARRSQRAVVAA